jgi:SAM-dependent methyltransferase
VKRGEYDVMAALEDRLWWYRGLRRLVVRGLANYLRAGPLPLIVDVGCGTGGTFRAVRAALPGVCYVGLDPEPKALEHCRSRGLRRLVQASLADMPVRLQSADALICLDVLCYRGVDVGAALRQFFEVLRPGGLLVVNLPAFESLRGEHDLAVGIARRFRASELQNDCRGAGFAILFLSYWNATLFLPLWLWRRLSRGTGEAEATSDTARSPSWLNAVLTGLVLSEVALTRWLRWPWGSSILVVARRPHR